MHEPDETEKLLIDAATRFLQQNSPSLRAQQVYQRRCVLDRAFWREMAAQGWSALRVDEADGGSGLSVRHAALLAEALGRHAVPEPFIACAVMPAVLLAQLPASGARAGLLQGLVDGERIATLAWQGQAQSLELSVPGVVAARCSAGVQLHGRSLGVVAATFADTLLVHALLDGEPTLWSVARDAQGIKVHEFLASDGGSVSAVEFDVLVHEDARLAQGGAVLAALQRAIDEATLLAAYQLRGTAEAAFALTLEHLRTRVQFDQTIGSFQAVQHAAVDVGVQIALARAACAFALQRIEDDAALPATRAAIAAAKARAADAALQATRFAVQMHGACGYAAEMDIGLYLKSALRQSAWLGSAAQQRQHYGRLSGLHEGEVSS